MSKASDSIYTMVRESILSGEFEPGARLKEEEIVARCGYSRTPVREALRQLASEDYISITANQGAQVKDWNSGEINDLFELRALLEGYAASRAAKIITLEALEAIDAAILEMDQILDANQPSDEEIEAFLRLNQVIHNTIWKAASSDRVESMLRLLIEQAVVVRTARNFSHERLSQSHRHHKEIRQALAVGDAAWAEAIMRSHIYAAQGDLLGG